MKTICRKFSVLLKSICMMPPKSRQSIANICSCFSNPVLTTPLVNSLEREHFFKQLTTVLKGRCFDT